MKHHLIFMACERAVYASADGLVLAQKAQCQPLRIKFRFSKHYDNLAHFLMNNEQHGIQQ